MIFPFVSTHLKLTVDAIWNLLLIDALKLLQNCNSLIDLTFGDQPPETTSFSNQETTVSKSRLGEPVDCKTWFFLILTIQQITGGTHQIYYTTFTKVLDQFICFFSYNDQICLEKRFFYPNKRFLFISPNP